jgi:asparagine N-glycosylation enzyme membrane subunit Stt3
MAALFLISIVNFVLVISGFSAVMEGSLLGPDSYMRLLRVTYLYESSDWFDISIPRSNAPYGEPLHWTRPADLLYLAGALALEPLFGFERALYLWGLCVGPLLHVSMIMMLVWAVSPVYDNDRRFLLIMTVIAQFAIWPQGVMGRTDHHMLILLTFVVALGGALRAMSGGSGKSAMLAAGSAAGFGLWLSVEFLMVILLIFAALTVCWVRFGGHLALSNLWHALGLAAVVLLALLVERPPDDWWASEYDRISVVHFLVGMLAVAFWGAMTGLARFGRALETPQRRLLACILGAAAAAGVMLLVFPKFFGGPEVDFDPQLKQIFLDVVTETQPLLPHNLRNTGSMLLYLGSTLFAVPYILLRLRRDRWETIWRFWLLIALGLFIYIPLALTMRRFTTFAAILLAVVLADLLSALLARARAESLVRRLLILAIVVPGILFAPMAVGGILLSQGHTQGSGGCSIDPVLRELKRSDGLGGAPMTVLAMVNFGPRLMYETPHRVITTPYPRNAEGQLDAFHIYKATDLEYARRLIEERRVDLIVTCVQRSMYGGLSASSDTLDSRLRRGEPPEWLRPVAIGDEAAREISIFRVHRRDT